MEKGKKVVANPIVVLREEFDDWAILFNPDTGDAFGLNPVSVFIWKHLNGKNGVDDIVKKLRPCCKGVPYDADTHTNKFVDDLVTKGMAGYEI
ncbi:MAG: SynChlorMet cassette protein ScmD [Omnitrophica bacterium RIFCSPLOWO2_01_FULL_45_10]|nr:MAG: SynChlorMet cassette protein ScmD [Omnitrophica bacterium RIFCSPLOWO2_01_FULL_45_10]